MSNRKKIPDNLKFRLFASAAGFCQNPACHEALFPQIMGGDKHIAEMAHVIPHGKKDQDTKIGHRKIMTQTHMKI